MFDPYGRVTICNPDGSEKTGVARVCSAYGNPFFFTGRRNDDETRWFDSSKPAGKEWQQGLMQFRFRYYDTGLGRFIGRDPIGYEDGFGLQEAYFAVDGTDPLGLNVTIDYLDPVDFVAQYPFKWNDEQFQELQKKFPPGMKPERPDIVGSASGGQDKTLGNTSYSDDSGSLRSNIKISCTELDDTVIINNGILGRPIDCGCWKCVVDNIDFSISIYSFAHYYTKKDVSYTHELDHVKILQTGFMTTFQHAETILKESSSYGGSFLQAKAQLEKWIIYIQRVGDNRLKKIKNLSSDYDLGKPVGDLMTSAQKIGQQPFPAPPQPWCILAPNANAKTTLFPVTDILK